MLVTGINKILGWCQVNSGGRTYTCPTEERNGELFFNFKKKDHRVKEYVCKDAEELVKEGGKVFSRPFAKR